MAAARSDSLEHRVLRAAETALAAQSFVSPIDVLIGLGWLPPARVDEWRQGRVDYLERAMTVNLNKLSTAMRLFRCWAQRRGLRPSETAYAARTRDRRSLRFSMSGDPEIERAYRTHWVSPELSASERERLAERQSRAPELVVISPITDWICAACGGTGGLSLMEGPGPLCMSCVDMDHLVFLPAGDAALTRRAKRASRLSAVVVRFSRARKRYERQGILVEEAALERAERECLADEEARAGRRVREEARREAGDLKLQEEIAREIARLPYDELLMSGAGRARARERVRSEVERILERWRTTPRVGRPLPPPPRHRTHPPHLPRSHRDPDYTIWLCFYRGAEYQGLGD